MARARNIKPGLFKNEILGVADPLYTLLFQGLWLLADREGRLEDRSLRIKVEVFPYRDGIDMNAMLGWLARSGFIQRYQCGGLALIQILNFTKHQNPHKNEPESIYAPPDELGTTSEEIGSAPADPGFLTPDSGLLIPAAAAPPPPKPKKQKAVETPLPADFAVSERVRGWAAERGFDRLDEHLESFRLKATAKAYTYVSWDDAFMVAIRDDWAKVRSRPTFAQQAADVRTTTVPAKPGKDPTLLEIEQHAANVKPMTPEQRQHLQQAIQRMRA